ncbi:MAG TPA: TolC family protein [Gemmatimonadales bacterium]|nr:TolC family protein [Gemmatimonadales bacterium]
MRFLPTLILAAMLPVAAISAQSPLRLSISDALTRADSSSEAIGIARTAVDAADRLGAELEPRVRLQHHAVLVGLGEGRAMQAKSGWLPQLSAAAMYTRTLKSQFEALAGDGEDNGGDDEPAPPPPENCLRFVPDPGQSVADRLANLERGLDCTANGNGGIDFSALPFGQANAWSFGLDAQQTLFDRSLISQGRLARAGRTGAVASLDAARAGSLLEVAQAYYDAQLAERLLAIAESTMAQVERTHRETELAHQVGNAAEFDLLRATVARDNQRPVVIQRRTARDLAITRLRQLLDIAPGTPIELTTPLGDTTAVRVSGYAIDGDPGSDAAIDARAVMREADAMVDAADAGVGIASGQRIPSVRLSSAYTKLAYPTDVFGFGTFLTDWNVAVRVSVPLFTGGRIAGQVREAEAQAEQARLQRQQIRELAALEAVEVRDQLSAAEARLAASQSTAAQARRAHEIAEIRVREGLSTLTDLSEVRLQLEQAEANQAQAARDVQVARLRSLMLRDLPLGAGQERGF